MTTPLRDDFDASGLRLLARRSKDVGQARRLLALAAIYEGGRRHEAAKIGGVTLQIVRDWVVKFNGRGPAGLIDGKAPGQSPLLDAVQRAALAAVVESGPTLAVHGVVRWRLVDLCHWVWQTFRISISPQTMSRELRAMNYRKGRGPRTRQILSTLNADQIYSDLPIRDEKDARRAALDAQKAAIGLSRRIRRDRPLSYYDLKIGP